MLHVSRRSSVLRAACVGSARGMSGQVLPAVPGTAVIGGCRAKALRRAQSPLYRRDHSGRSKQHAGNDVHQVRTLELRSATQARDAASGHFHHKGRPLHHLVFARGPFVGAFRGRLRSRVLVALFVGELLRRRARGSWTLLRPEAMLFRIGPLSSDSTTPRTRTAYKSKGKGSVSPWNWRKATS